VLLQNFLQKNIFFLKKKEKKVFLTKEQDTCEIVQQHMEMLFSERILASNSAVNQCRAGGLTCKINGFFTRGNPKKTPVSGNTVALPQMQIYKGA